MRLLTYNPQRDSPALLSRLTCGEDRIALMEQIRISLEAEIGRSNHQHHVIIGPRGSGKSHILRILTDHIIQNDKLLSNAYVPIPMPEETPLRSPADLFLKIIERLADTVQNVHGKSDHVLREVHAICLSAIQSARPVKDPVDRLEIANSALAKVSKKLNAILLPTVENFNNILFRGAGSTWKKRDKEHWALRKHLQNTSHLLILASSPTRFGAIDDHSSPFYGFLQVHMLDELENDALIRIIERRLDEEVASSAFEPGRAERVKQLKKRFPERKKLLRGVLAITGGMPRYAHLVYDVIVDTDVKGALETLNGFLDELTPLFQQRLDPNLIPEAELDLVHTLAMARGPLSPSELSSLMYGVPVNEVSQLLIRLRAKGLVKSIPKPNKKKPTTSLSKRAGKRSAAWDLTEPLYRVWTQFRFNPSAQDQYALLAEIVTILFSLDDINRERRYLSSILEDRQADNVIREHVQSRKEFLDFVYEHAEKSWKDDQGGKEALAEKTTVHDIIQKASFKVGEGDSQGRERAVSILNSLSDAIKENDLDRRDQLLEELRKLSSDCPDDTAIRKQLTRGLFITFYYAKEENNLERCDRLLEELRKLATDYPDDVAARKLLALGLVITLISVKEENNLERRDQLLEELRKLSSDYFDDAAAREQLAWGLVNTLNSAKEENDLERRDQLLDELRKLSTDYPDDAVIRETFARALFNNLNSAKEENDLARRDQLMNELRQLSTDYPDDAVTREKFAGGLFNTLNFAKEENNLERRDQLLDELRKLSTDYPDDAATREELAWGLLNTLNSAIEENDLKRLDQLLDELRKSSFDYPDDAATRKQLAMGLVITLVSAKEENDLERRDQILNELRKLSTAYPDDAATRKQLATGLVITLNSAIEENDLERRDQLLEELRQLSTDYSDDVATRERLAWGLDKTLNSAKEENDFERRDRLLDELRKLSTDYPDDAATRKQLARGLVITLISAKEENDLERRDQLLDKLRKLSTAYPDDAATREQLARGLVNTHIYATEEKDFERHDQLLDELRKLSTDYPDDAATREGLARGLVNTLHDAKEEKKYNLADNVMDELLTIMPDLPQTEEVIDVLNGGITMYLTGVLQAVKMKQNFTYAEQRLSDIEKKIPTSLLELIRLFKLAFYAIRDGFDTALLKEPEEIRRVVKIILERAGHQDSQKAEI